MSDKTEKNFNHIIRIAQTTCIFSVRAAKFEKISFKHSFVFSTQFSNFFYDQWTETGPKWSDFRCFITKLQIYNNQNHNKQNDERIKCNNKHSSNYLFNGGYAKSDRKHEHQNLSNV